MPNPSTASSSQSTEADVSDKMKKVVDSLKGKNAKYTLLRTCYAYTLAAEACNKTTFVNNLNKLFIEICATHRGSGDICRDKPKTFAAAEAAGLKIEGTMAYEDFSAKQQKFSNDLYLIQNGLAKEEAARPIL